MVSVHDKIKVVSRSPGNIKHLRDRFPKMNLSNSLIRGNSSSNFLCKHDFSRFHLSPFRYYSELKSSKSSDPTETIEDLDLQTKLNYGRANRYKTYNINLIVHIKKCLSIDSIDNTITY